MAEAPVTFCTNCGAHLEPDAHFCGVCGRARAGTGAETAPDEPAAGSGDAPSASTPAQPTTPPDPATAASAPTAVVPPVAPAAAAAVTAYGPPGGPGAAGVGPGGPVSPVAGYPPGPYGAPPVARRRSPLLIIAGIVATIALIAALATIVWVTRSPDTAAADELVLEPVAYQSPDPFTASVTTAPETPPAASAVKVAPNTQNPGGQQVPGAQPGLYGGTRNNGTCDPEQLIGYLQANPDKAAAWAGVIGIPTAEIAGYVRGLTPILLTRDTRVTNHGFVNGRATTIPAVLQAGTAVLVDRYGTPRVKCGCGNPLTEPGPITTGTKVRGTPWAGFTVATTVVVTVTVQVNVFVLVDVSTGQLYVRPPGSSGRDDADAARDQVCAAFPNEPVCATTTTTSTTSTTTTTAPPTTPPPTSPPTVPPTAPDYGDQAGTAISIAQAAVAQCGQGGALGQWSAVETEPGVYRVSVPVTFENATVTDIAVFRVDLNAANHNLAAQDPVAAELICGGA